MHRRTFTDDRVLISSMNQIHKPQREDNSDLIGSVPVLTSEEKNKIMAEAITPIKIGIHLESHSVSMNSQVNNATNFSAREVSPEVTTRIKQANNTSSYTMRQRSI